MSTYESVSSVGIDDATGNVIIPKPTGLAVGDLMVAGVRSFLNAASVSITPPAGWTTEETTTVTSGGSPSQRLSVFTKLAESADVSASDFTFSTSGSAIQGGIMVRVSSAGLSNAGESSTALTLTGTSTTLSTFTPSRADCLFIFFGSRGSNVTHTADITSVSLTTDNPTWTERAQVVLNTTNRSHVLSCFTATRTQATATGTITFSFSSPGSDMLTNGIMLTISPQVNGSVTPTHKLNSYALSPIQSVELDAMAATPTYSTGRLTRWTSTNKS